MGLAVAAGLMVSACGTPRGSASPTTTSRAPLTTTTVPEREQPGWAVATKRDGVILADRRTYRLADGAVITVYRFRVGEVAYELHAGSEDPPGVAAVVDAEHGPALTPGERSRVVAAFNGGFKTSSDSGGFMVEGRTFVPLQHGLASLVIDANGAAHVGVWGGGLPVAGEHVVAVRQNLAPLIADGRPSPQVGDLLAWGATLHSVPNVARSALGQDREGDLLFAGSMHALPQDLAAALLAAGAVRAMELDINPYWVQLDTSRRPGGPLLAAIPSQEQPGNQYAVGWTRDFISVLAARP